VQIPAALIGACEGAPAGARKLARRMRSAPVPVRRESAKRARGAPQGAYERRREIG